MQGLDFRIKAFIVELALCEAGIERPADFKISVYCRGDDLIGRVTFDREVLSHSPGGFEKWFPLSPVRVYNQSDVQGEVRIEAKLFEEVRKSCEIYSKEKEGQGWGSGGWKVDEGKVLKEVGIRETHRNTLTVTSKHVSHVRTMRWRTIQKPTNTQTKHAAEWSMRRPSRFLPVPNVWGSNLSVEDNSCQTLQYSTGKTSTVPLTIAVGKLGRSSKENAKVSSDNSSEAFCCLFLLLGWWNEV